MRIDTDEIIVMAKKAARGAERQVSRLAATAEVKTGEAIDRAKVSYRIMELKAEIGELKKQVGDIVCRAHRGGETSQTELEDLLFELDAKIDELDGIRARRASGKTKCSSCGKVCSAVSKFCNECGAVLGK